MQFLTLFVVKSRRAAPARAPMEAALPVEKFSAGYPFLLPPCFTHTVRPGEVEVSWCGQKNPIQQRAGTFSFVAT